MTLQRELFKSIAGPAAVTLLILLVPLVTMQFTNEVKWTIYDFLAAGILLFATGFSYKLLTKKSENSIYKTACIIALGSGFFLIWANLAVGITDSGNNPLNIVYFVVVAIGIFGAFAARFRPKGMALTMFMLAALQSLITIIILLYALTHNIEFTLNDILRYLAINGIFILLFILSGILYRNAAQD